jgi:endonuclease-3 related protein
MEEALAATKAETMNKAAGPILRNFHDQLAAAYGPQQWWPAQTPLEVIVGAYLTQNTSWKGVERSIHNLVERGVMNLDGLRAVPEDELRTLIRPSGYMVRRSRDLSAFLTGSTVPH